MNIDTEHLAIAADSIRERIDNAGPNAALAEGHPWRVALAAIRAAIDLEHLGGMDGSELLAELYAARVELADAAVAALEVGDFVDAYDDQARRYALALSEVERRTQERADAAALTEIERRTQERADGVIDPPDGRVLNVSHAPWRVGQEVWHALHKQRGVVVGERSGFLRVARNGEHVSWNPAYCRRDVAVAEADDVIDAEIVDDDDGPEPMVADHCGSVIALGDDVKNTSTGDIGVVHGFEPSSSDPWVTVDPGDGRGVHEYPQWRASACRLVTPG